MDIEIFSFFSGLGLLDLGFEKAGFKIDFINEVEEKFLYAYKFARKGMKEIPYYGYSTEDIRSYLKDENWNRCFGGYNNRNKKITGFIGGPPCPDFSVAGKNEGGDGRNGQLTEVYKSLIIKRQPDFFVLENVKGLCKTEKHKKFYEKIKRDFLLSGYMLFDSIENSLEYGVPQYRDRLFLVGFKEKVFGKKIKFKIGSHKKYSLEDLRKIKWPSISKFSCDNSMQRPDGIAEELTVEYWFRKNDVENHLNAGDIFKIKNHDKYNQIPEGMTKGKSFKRLHRWRYAPTSAYGNNEVHLHPYKRRRISVAEALAIQSAPKYFNLPINLSLTAKFKMIGNGVPVLLAQGLALDIKDFLART